MLSGQTRLHLNGASPGQDYNPSIVYFMDHSIGARNTLQHGQKNLRENPDNNRWQSPPAISQKYLQARFHRRSKSPTPSRHLTARARKVLNNMPTVPTNAHSAVISDCRARFFHQHLANWKYSQDRQSR